MRAALVLFIALSAACTSRPANVRLLVFPGRAAAAATLARLLDTPVVSARDYAASIELVGAGEADAALLNDFGYLLARDLYGVEPVLKVVRYGAHMHKAAIVARPGPERLADLHGKHFAFSDPYSTTGFLLPADMLGAEAVLLKSASFAGSPEEVVRRVYKGEADAGAVFWNAPGPAGEPRDARALVAAEHTDVFDRVRVLATSVDVPNEPLVFRKDLDERRRARLLDGLQKLATTEEGRAALAALGEIERFTRASDADYASLRKLLVDYGGSIEDMVPGGWKLRVHGASMPHSTPSPDIAGSQ